MTTWTALCAECTEDNKAALAALSHVGTASGGFWEPPDPTLATGEHADEYVGYDLGSVWYETSEDKDTRLWPYKLELPANPSKLGVGRLTGNYSRSPLQEMERIVRTYMRHGDTFLEVCAGWWTFSATAALWGFNGDGIDLWDVSLGFGRRQFDVMINATLSCGEYLLETTIRALTAALEQRPEVVWGR